MNRFFSLLVVTLLLSGCASTQNGQALMRVPHSPVIFSLESEQVTVADFTARLEREIGTNIAAAIAEGQTRAQIEQQVTDQQIRNKMFEGWVQEALIKRYARQHGIGINAAAVDTTILSASTPASDSLFVSTTTKRVLSAYEQQRLEVIAYNTRTTMVHARHILVADEAAAAQVLADLAAGGTFATIARERSLDKSSAAQGGDLGWVPKGNFSPEFDTIAFAAPFNTPTKIVSQNGVQVVEVLERQEDRAFTSLEQLQNSPNAGQFVQASVPPWYNELRRQAETSGELQIAANFDPNTVPLPFPAGTP